MGRESGFGTEGCGAYRLPRIVKFTLDFMANECNIKVVNNLDNQDKLRYKWCPGPPFNSSTGVSAIVEIARFGR